MRTQDIPQRIGRTTNVLRRNVWNVDIRKKRHGLGSQNKCNGLEWQLVTKEQKKKKDKEGGRNRKKKEKKETEKAKEEKEKGKSK